MPAQYPSDRRPLSVDVTSNKTLTAADSGIVQNVIADAIVITLPSTANGLTYTVRNGGKPVTNGPAGSGSNGTVLVSLSPAAADGFTGGFTGTPTVNKDLLNTKATSLVGDYVTVTGTGTAGVTGWIVTEATGTWVRES